MVLCFRSEKHIIFKCKNKAAWDLYLLEAYHDISITHADSDLAILGKDFYENIYIKSKPLLIVG